jgi:hypothetical protein
MLRIRIAGLCAALVSVSALAVEPLPADILLFGGEEGALDLPRLLEADFDPATPGREILSVAFSCNISATDSNGYLTVTDRTRFTIKSADGVSTYFSTSAPGTMVSAPIPDYRLAKFQCGGTQQTYYHSDEQEIGTPNTPSTFCSPGFLVKDDIYQHPSFCDGLLSDSFGWGFATTSGGARVFVLGQALTGGHCQYNASTNTDLGCTDTNKYRITVFNLDGSVRWTKAVAPLSNGLEFDRPFSAAGDFLPATGDEIRLAYSSFDSNRTTIRYDYLNLGTGALISSATVIQNCPITNSCN